MSIIFGWGKKTFKISGPTLQFQCSNCNELIFFHLYSVKTWVSLFGDLIPLVPYSCKYFLCCKKCLKGIELGAWHPGTQNSLVKQAKELKKATRLWLGKRISEEEYRRILNKAITLKEALNSQQVKLVYF